MVKKSASEKDNAKQPTVTRVTAKDDTKPAKKRPQSAKKAVVVNGDGSPKKQNAFKKFIGYFKGAWFELRQVRWPNRRATWSMTGALLTFTAIFIGFIVVIDLVFDNLFQLIISSN